MNQLNMNQLNIFEYMYPKYKIDKPIRLIELFGGIGSQAKALENLGADFTHYKLVEYDKYPVASYNAIHNTNFVPLDITKIHANDLEIADRDIYIYMLTYSFPCQDLSLAGLGKGMKRNSGTRSGLLWEVERLLNECGAELPQILLMENVPQVIGEKNKNDFDEWCRFLESKGYSNYYELLNAKDYGIPQNRNRCFMVSILGDYYYEFPKPIELKLKLKDMLEENVDEKYYLSDRMIKGMQSTKFSQYSLEKTLQDVNGTADTIVRLFDHAPLCIAIKNATSKGYLPAYEGDGIDISSRMESHRGTVQPGMAQTLKTSCDCLGVVVKAGQFRSKDRYYNKHNAKREIQFEERSDDLSNALLTNEIHNAISVRKIAIANELRIRKLTPLECWRLMGFSDEDYQRASKVNSNAQLYKQAGNSIVVNVLMYIFTNLL